MLEGAKLMGAGAATIALAGAAVGIGNVFSSLIHSVARNPSLAKQSFGYAILGFALTEAIALFAPMMAFLISFVFQRRFQFHKAPLVGLGMISNHMKRGPCSCPLDSGLVPENACFLRKLGFKI
uniref:ATP synthase subunit 9, mitochondrial n=1 Tax=Tribulus terrestris TaxID=210369 RepID=A0A8K1T0B3_TRITE|nr:ATPase subunit 9 [Tribulus terrestris]